MRRTRRRLHRTTRLLWFSLAVSIAFGLSLGSLAGADQTAGVKAWKAKDYQRAFQEFSPLAEAGDAVAQYFLGTMHLAGQHVPVNPAAAFRWWREAADQGYGPAQVQVAAAYIRGIGVAVDVGEAFHWASLAAANALAPQDAATKLRDTLAQQLQPDARRGIEARIAAWSPRRAPMPEFTGTNQTLKKRGSGFFVDDRGHVLTNYHLVDGCGTLRRSGGAGNGDLTPIATDSTRDLALLRGALDGAKPLAASSQRRADLGAPVIVVGFPIVGSNTLVTNGIVNSQVGAQGQTGFFQVSAAIQPGSSGGPVLDASGHFIGLATLGAEATSARQGGVALALAVLAAFLAENGVNLEWADRGQPLSSQEIVANGIRGAIAVECWR